jgi:hypothetical protein
MLKYNLLRTIIDKSNVLSNFYEADPTEDELEELYDIIKKDMLDMELEDIVLEKLNDSNIVVYWNFVYKYDFNDKMDIKSKIYKYVRVNDVKLKMNRKLVSNKVYCTIRV